MNNGLHHNAKHLTGQRFGRLTAIEPTEKRYDGKIVYHCLCDCGKQCFIRSSDLRKGHTRSCGCLVKDVNTTHGMTKTSIYSCWTHMIQRCENPQCAIYKYYGGRGIKVCDRWHKFENFYEDVGDPPEGMTLDRWPNNDGNYEPTNFRWASCQEQSNNQRPKSCGSRKQYWFYGHGPNGEMIIENNQHHVARIFGLTFQNISHCLNGKQKTHKGWTFQRISN